jgi:hypothetical protein
MKIEQIDKYRANEPCSVFTAKYQVGSPPVDVIYGGTIHGNIFYILQSVALSRDAFIVEVTCNLPTDTIQRRSGPMRGNNFMHYWNHHSF